MPEMGRDFIKIKTSKKIRFDLSRIFSLVFIFKCVSKKLLIRRNGKSASKIPKWPSLKDSEIKG